MEVRSVLTLKRNSEWIYTGKNAYEETNYSTVWQHTTVEIKEKIKKGLNLQKPNKIKQFILHIALNYKGLVSSRLS